MTEVPSGTVTFLFTDIDGSTRLIERLGDRYAAMLADYLRLMRACIRGRAGHEMGTQGDALFAAFNRARDAVFAAVEAQRAIATQAWPDGLVIRVRMGLHTGDPVIADAGYVGMDVHRGARICAAAHGGQILVSQATRELLGEDLPNATSLRDLGEHRLKDLAVPQHLFQVVAADLPAEFPPLQSLSVPSHNLPVQLTSFIGREHEIAEVKAALSRARLVTLNGPGGAGKTRMALQVCSQTVEAYSSGVWLIELASLTEPTLVPQAVAKALRLPEHASRPLLDTLIDYLRSKSLLFLLDNCEHLSSASAHLAEAVLRDCPHVKILATSREALGLRGEVILFVPPLSMPDARHPPSLDHLRQYEAVRLFIERAVASQPDFAVTDRNAPEVLRLCHRLDGLPLAIELAAARAKFMTVEQIAARLDDRFRLLSEGSRAVLPRHQTLRAAMDWSYDLLTDKERAVLRRLAVFAGGWTLEAAEAVCAAEDIKPAEVMDLLAQLVDKSLVVADLQRREAWYRLLETVREYARDRLIESGEVAATRRRHHAWYLQLAENVEPELRGPSQEVWLDRLETEHDNLRAALEWSKIEEDGAEAGLRLAGALHWFWWVRGHWTEGRAWLEGALARRSTISRAILPKAFLGAAILARVQEDYARATVLLEHGLNLARELGDKERVTWFLMNLGVVAWRQGERGRATALFEDSLSRSREQGDPWLTCVALAQLGSVAWTQGNPEGAEALHTESLALGRKVGDKSLISYALRNLGITALLQGSYLRAGRFYKDGLRLWSGVGDHWVTQECLEGLAAVACAQGYYDQAVRLFGAAEALRDTLGLHLPDPIRAAHDQRVVAARRALGNAAFDAAWADGRALPLGQAIEYALGVEIGEGEANPR